MNSHPDSPLLAIGMATICALLAYGCHRLIRRIEANDLMPLSKKLVGDTGRNFPMPGTWPFKDKYTVTLVRRSMLPLQLVLWKWMLMFAAVLAGVVYPVVYLLRLLGVVP